ncbi:MAG: sulfurtransferase [Proteobacteria bacterium]|nr:sulfurtransferase [Pseudomonadota bacterium]
MFTLFPAVSFAEKQGLYPYLHIDKLSSLPKGDVVILDTRSRWKYFLGHIPGAQHIGDWQDFTAKTNDTPGILSEDKRFLADKFGRLGIQYPKSVILYGDPSDKWRSDGRFFWMFKYLGFHKVAILEGGFKLWKQIGMPIERGTAEDVPPSDLAPEQIHFDKTVSADQTWIRERLGLKSTAIIDTRTKEEFAGKTPYGSPRGGHIPGAVNIYWMDFFTRSGMLKSREQLTTILRQSGISEDQEVVVYCTGGVRSAMSFFALRYLGYKVRNYDGSWWEWSRTPPIEGES